MRSVSSLLDVVALPEDPVRPGRRPRFLTAVPTVGARVVLVGGREGDRPLLEADKYFSLVSLLVELIVLLEFYTGVSAFKMASG